MTVTMRRYDLATDYDTVDRFLVECFVPGNRIHAWLQPRWEYMHSHSNIETIRLEDIGIAEDDGTVLGVVHPEHSPAFVYLQIRPGHPNVVFPLLDWAEKYLGGWSESFQREMLGIFVNDERTATQVAERGFALDEYREAYACIALTTPPPSPSMPGGYRIQSLAEDNDLSRINRVLWRGFNHEGPPPDALIPSRRRAQQTPNYSLDLNVVAVSPNGDFASYAGIWIEPKAKVAYVEPVATDPDHRRRGLAAAVVVECLRRAHDLGAKMAWVGSEQDFYKALGFEVTCVSNLWTKEPEPTPQPSKRQHQKGKT